MFAPTDTGASQPGKGTIGAELVGPVPTVGPEEPVWRARRLLSTPGEASDAGTVAVCDGGILVGLLTPERLAGSVDEAVAGAVMISRFPRVAPDEPRERSAWRAIESGAQVVAVESPEGRLLGIVPPGRLLAALLAEHRQDMARLSGYLHDVEVARTVSRETLWRRFWHRLPWLAMGLVGAMAAAGVMGRYEEVLAANVLIAFFIPGIVYLADAVGTQTETLIVRGLSVGVTIRSVVLRELATGVLVGGALAFIFLVAGGIIWPDHPSVIASASLAVGIACATATGVAMALPALFRALGMDPAFGSGPLATVIQDILSIVVYLWVTTWMLGG